MEQLKRKRHDQYCLAAELYSYVSIVSQSWVSRWSERYTQYSSCSSYGSSRGDIYSSSATNFVFDLGIRWSAHLGPGQIPAARGWQGDWVNGWLAIKLIDWACWAGATVVSGVKMFCRRPALHALLGGLES